MIIKRLLGAATDSQLNMVSCEEHEAKSLTSLYTEGDLNSREICSEYGTKQESNLESVM